MRKKRKSRDLISSEIKVLKLKITKIRDLLEIGIAINIYLDI